MILATKVDINREFVFSKISATDVYAYELPEVQIGQAICSPLRNDHNPSMILKVGQSGQLRHIDWAYPDDERFSGGPVDFIMSRYSLSYDKALRKICQDFHLLDEENKYKEITDKFTKPIMDIKRTCLIQVSTRKFCSCDKTYWGQYLIPIEGVKKEEIYPTREVYINRRRVPIKPNELVYAYRRPGGFKIYFPERTKKEGRWLSNIPLSDMNHLENLSKNHNSLIIPSLKCYMVCVQIYPHTSQMQNESRGSLTPEIVQRIASNSKKVFYGGNNDLPGKEASYKITGDHGWSHLNPPDYLLPNYTDWSDWAKKEQSLKQIEHHFRKKGLMD